MSALRRSAAVAAATAVLATGTVSTALLTSTSSSASPAANTAAAVPAGNPKVPNARPCCGSTFLRPGDQLRSDNPAGAWLQSGGLGAGPDYLSTFSKYALDVQDDGNMVEYDGTSPSRHAVWSTGTAGAAAPVALTFQTDGNVVLRDRTGKAIWASGTAGKAAQYFDVYGNGQVVTQDSTGRVLGSVGPAQVAFPGIEVDGAVNPGYWTDDQHSRSLVAQSDGNLAEYVYSGTAKRAVWSTKTAGAGAAVLSAQSDGNLVLRQVSTGRAVWSSGSHGPTAYYQVDLQDDGNLVLYRTDGIRRVQAVWSTGVRN